MMKFEGFPQSAFHSKAAGMGLAGGFRPHLAATVLAVGYLLYVLSGLSPFKPADPQPQAGSAAQSQATTSSANSGNPPDLSAIGAWHLFGLDSGQTAVGAGVAETQLQLKLLGMVLLPQAPKHNSAIIQADGGQQKQYRLGDELPGGAVLSAVQRDRVLLKNGDREEALFLVRDNLRVPTATE